MRPRPTVMSPPEVWQAWKNEWARHVDRLDRVIGSAEALALVDDDVRGGFAETIAEYVRAELTEIEFTVSGRVEGADRDDIAAACQRVGRIMKALAGENKPSPVYDEYRPRLTGVAAKEARSDPKKPLGACCNNEQRGMNGGCGNCGAPCL